MYRPSLSSAPHGLYDARYEHDGCGIGFVARINGQASYDILTMALMALGNQAHRGAVAADANTGDGAGILTQLPKALLLRELRRLGIQTQANDLAVGMFFLPQETAAEEECCQLIERTLTAYGLKVLTWRNVPTNDRVLGQRALENKPRIRQALIAPQIPFESGHIYERTLFLARKTIEVALKALHQQAYIPSLSSRTIVYKGLLVGTHLACFYPDLRDPAYTTAIAVYHQRYSTNTFPTWERAQPFRMLSHNGEINTLQGNVNWMRARESKLCFPSLTPDGPSPSIVPVIDEQGSDSGMLDNALELLVVAGRDIRHAMAMLVPEAWEKTPDLDPDLRAFYRYHACMSEPWDGPAALTFSDGRIVGTALDRNGLRPTRYRITDDGLVISGSEAGVVPVEDHHVIYKGRLGPGQMIAVDTVTGKFYANEEIKAELAARRPYAQWIKEHLVTLPDLMEAQKAQKDGQGQGTLAPTQTPQELKTLQLAFGYTSEELTMILKPMAQTGMEPVGSMGDDTPLAVLSQVALGRPLFAYFKQRFAEVTNPPIDPIREELVMSLGVKVGKRRDILDETPEHAHLLYIDSPIITDAQLAAIRANTDPLFRTATITTLIPLQAGSAETINGAVLRKRLTEVCAEAEQAAKDGATILIISDRGVDAHHVPIPALLAVGAIHHHLIRAGWRGRMSLICESGEPREVHHLACLSSYGARVINPYLALASACEVEPTQQAKAEQNYLKALEKGLLKIMSKMGISPIESYCGAQIFEAVGLDQETVDLCFTGTPLRLTGGDSFERLAKEVMLRHQQAFATPGASLADPGLYRFRREGEAHLYSPAVVRALHAAVFPDGPSEGSITEGNGGPSIDPATFQAGYTRYRVYADLVNERVASEPRDLLAFTPVTSPIPLEEVEPLEAIVKRFSTAAISHGALSTEAHETLAIAMNRLGGLSNSGEGGENPARYTDERNSQIKQIASGRFGVTPIYLVNANELQIKMAQGSKPGEGGHLPSHKVSVEIAAIRHTTPGVALISPPPHHDIYSIEDLAQLIYDLKQINPTALISVKLVATAGVGTVAAGVAKGYADLILISGASGGTGASPLSSIKYAGVAWELGLAETQQTLVLNNLRGRVRIRADGGFQTGRDVVIGALLGADEFSFGTVAMIAEGCRMARVCHANSCPAGIATQRPDLRAKYIGKPEMVIAFFRYLAQEVRELLAALGLRSLEEAVGRTDLLKQRLTGLPHADALDLSPVLAAPVFVEQARSACEGQLLEIHHAGVRNAQPQEETLNDRLLYHARETLANGQPLELTYSIQNSDRTVGASLAGAISKAHGSQGLPPATVLVNLWGSAGQSFGAFNVPGMHLRLIGEANDYVGKGMAGGEIVIRPSDEALFTWHENVIIGNTVLYGATGGELFAAGRAGERFAVRNSGATAVVEGLGDHGCEYMTNGCVVVLGPVGYNFGAGMTGGVAYVLDEANSLAIRYNRELVQLDQLTTQDEDQVKALIERHLSLTKSPFAAEVLTKWEAYRPLFWRVMSREAVAKLEKLASNEVAALP